MKASRAGSLLLVGLAACLVLVLLEDASPEGPPPPVAPEPAAPAPRLPTDDVGPREAPRDPPGSSPPMPPSPPPPPAAAVEEVAAVAVAASAEPSVPVWPDDWPRELVAPEFERLARRAVETCRTPLRFEGVDCTEAPCYAVFSVARDERRQPGDNEVLEQFVDTCDAWNAPFGHVADRFTRCSRAMVCSDGSEAWLLMLTSERVWEWMGVRDDAAIEAAKHAQERRCDVLMRAYRC